MIARLNVAKQIVIAGAMLGLCVSGGQAAETVVDQRDLMFAPADVTIAAGDTIRFTDSDRITHNIFITFPDGTSEDKGMDRYKEDIIVHFIKPGVYQVHCLLHPMMHMTVTVTPDAKK